MSMMAFYTQKTYSLSLKSKKKNLMWHFFEQPPTHP